MDDRTDRWTLRSGGLSLECGRDPRRPPHVMGILNITPDSFFDGGQYLTVDDAADRAEAMIAEGAAIIDIGGASSRPRGTVYGSGAPVVEADEEKARVLPVVKEVARRFPSTWISVDTYLPEVARDALSLGAHIINDITGLRLHPELATVAADAEAPMILMHSVGRPGDLEHAVENEDVVDTVLESLTRSIAIASDRGVDQIIVDPGFGFGKSVTDNLRLIGKLDRFFPFDLPILVGISRKSTIGSVLASVDRPCPVSDRLFGSLGATAVAALRGASIVRTHDVRETVDMLKVLAATLDA